MLGDLQFSLDALNTQRAQVAGADWVLQHCWLVQVKPGGAARTDAKYWQARSRQPLFEGKKLKHLKPTEVEAYRAGAAVPADRSANCKTTAANCRTIF